MFFSISYLIKDMFIWRVTYKQLSDFLFVSFHALARSTHCLVLLHFAVCFSIYMYFDLHIFRAILCSCVCYLNYKIHVPFHKYYWLLSEFLFSIYFVILLPEFLILSPSCWLYNKNYGPFSASLTLYVNQENYKSVVMGILWQGDFSFRRKIADKYA